MIILVAGADGAGKTTLANRLAAELGYQNIYLGYNLQRRIFPFMHGYICRKPLNPFSRVLRWLFIFVNDLLMARLLRGGNFVCDRYLYDRLIGYELKGYWLPRWVYQIVLILYPKPHLVIYLEGNVDIIVNRKKEISKLQYVQFSDAYLKWINLEKLRSVSIDTTMNNVSAVLSIAMPHCKKIEMI